MFAILFLIVQHNYVSPPCKGRETYCFSPCVCLSVRLSVTKSCPLYNLITVTDISMKLHTFVKHIETKCHAQELLHVYFYTPGIYAEGYIVFVFPFVRSYVRMFVRSFVRSFVLPSVTWNLRQSFALKFLKWCISQQLLIRKHSYLDHSYPGGLAFTP